MSDDEGTPVKQKIYSTPEGKEKTRSKFKNILDDLELKMPKPKSFIKKTEQESTNSKIDTTNSKIDTTNSKVELNNTNTISNNKNTNKDSKNKTQSQSNSKNETSNKSNKIRKFESFEEKSSKNANKKINNPKIKIKTSENILANDRNKTKRFIKINTPNTSFKNSQSSGNLSLKLNHDNRFNRNDLIITKKNYNSKNNNNSNNSSKSKNEKLRPSTPGIRTNSNINENIKNISNSSINNINLSSPNINKININSNSNSKSKDKNNLSPVDNKIDPLYIPHIVKDPLDILRHQVDLILEQSNEDITTLSNNISLIDIEMESTYAKIHENYANELQNIYKEKEMKLIETNNKYDFALFKMFKTYGHENNIIYDEMMKDKVEQILEIEQEFNAKKLQIKNNFNNKIEEIKKIYEKKRKEQENSNANLIKEMKKKIYLILYEDENKKNNNNKDDSIDNKKLRKKKAISMNKK